MKLKSGAIAIFTTMLATSVCFAAQQDSTSTETVQKLSAEYKTAMESFHKQIESIDDKQAKAKALESDPTVVFTQRFAQLMREHPEDALGAASWIACNKSIKNAELKSEAIKLIKEHFLKSDKIADVVQSLRRAVATSQTMEFLREVSKYNPSQSLRGLATLILAEKLSDSSPPEAERLFKELTDNFAEVDNAGREKGKLGEIAARYLFEIQHLTVGRAAPSIEGGDLNDKKMSLSDYRGKVILLTFFGDW